MSLPEPTRDGTPATDKLERKPQARPKSDVQLPDVDGLTLADAALAYADCGWYLLPTDPAIDIKNPGSVVGGR